MKENREEVLIQAINDLIAMIEKKCADNQQEQVESLMDQLEETLELLTAFNHKKRPL